MTYSDSSLDAYSDDPITEVTKSSSGNTYKLIVISLFVGSLFLVNGVMAGNISLGSNGAEFGQGVQKLKTCAEGANLSMSQTTQYSGGAFYLKSISVSNVPSSCYGYDLVFSVLVPGVNGSSTLAPFFAAVTKLAIYDKAGSFYSSNSDAPYIVLTSSSSGMSNSLTISFSTLFMPVSSIGALGVESSENIISGLGCGSGGDCPLGSSGPDGGIILVSSDQPFTSSGSPCDLNCHFIEVETGTLVSEVWSKNGAGTSTNGTVGAVYHGIGGGYMNTKLAQESPNGANNNPNRTGAISYCWNNTKGGAGTGTNHWYLPTVTEYAWFFNSVKGSAAIRNQASMWPAVTAYYTSEEAATSATFPSLWATNYSADGPPPGIGFYSVNGDVMAPTGAISISPITSANAYVNSTFGDFAKIQVFPHAKTSGYGIICAHAFS